MYAYEQGIRIMTGKPTAESILRAIESSLILDQQLGSLHETKLGPLHLSDS